MKTTLKISFLILISCILNCKNNSEKILDGKEEIELIDDYSIKIDSLIQASEPRKFNGVILITHNGETKYSKTYGYSNFENKTPFKINDNFRIQSNSKQITAALILKEVEKGNIELDKTIKEYLPEFKQPWAEKVTIHQLLNMSSGISGLDEPLLFEPGSNYKYSNPGYGLLGRIIKKVTGQKYSEVANAFLKEVGMNNSYCYELGKAKKDLRDGYWIIDGEYNLAEFDDDSFGVEEWDDFIPAGGIISNVHDLNTWDTKLHGGKILDSDSYKLMTTSSNKGPHAAFDSKTIGYGYGVRIQDKPALHIGHGGRGFGFVCLKIYIPEKAVDVIIWENIYSRDPDFMAGDIVYYYENEIRKIVVNSNLAK